jgi:transportin-3
MKSSWSVLERTTKRFPHDIMLAEKVCRLHKHALRTCGAELYTPLLDPLLQVLVQSFAESHQSPYLYCASICITEYGRKPQYVQTLFDMLQTLAQTTFSFLHNLQDLTAHPDVVEELFYLMGRMMTYCPEPLANCPGLLNALFGFAVVGMELDHRDANRGTLNFLESTVTYGTKSGGQSRSNLILTLQQQGGAIVMNLVRALMGDLPAYRVDSGNGSISGILFKLNMLMPDVMRQQWLPQALQHAPERPRGEFLGAFDAPSRDDFDMVVRSFRSACERYRRLKSGPP